MSFSLSIAGLSGASGVGLGAFGAHALKAFLEKRGRFHPETNKTLISLFHALTLSLFHALTLSLFHALTLSLFHALTLPFDQLQYIHMVHCGAISTLP